MSPTLTPVSREAQWATFVLSLVGLGLSIYLTIAHFEGTQILACAENSVVNCAAVTTSAQSYFLGIPVAILGLATYLVLVVVNSPWGWNVQWYWLHVARFALIAASMAFVLWLITAELLIIDHICLYCTGVHVVTFILLIICTRVCPAQLGWTRSATQESSTL